MSLPTVNRSALCGKQCTVVQIGVAADGKFVLTSPVNGTITSWSFRSGANGSNDSYALRVVRQSGTQFTSVATTPAQKLADDNDLLRGPFPVSIAVKAGDKLGLRVLGGSGKSDQYDVPTIPSGASDIYGPFYNPDLTDGGPARAPDFTSPGQQIPVQATIQTATPPARSPKPDEAVAQPAHVRRRRAGLERRPQEAHACAARRSPSRCRAPPRPRSPFQRAVTGRRVNRRCVAQRRSNRTKPRCTRYVTVRGSFTRAGRAGANSFRFTGRLRGRKLSLGRYRLTAVAANANGRSRAATTTFRIAR